MEYRNQDGAIPVGARDLPSRTIRQAFAVALAALTLDRPDRGGEVLQHHRRDRAPRRHRAEAALGRQQDFEIIDVLLQGEMLDGEAIG